MIRKQLTYLLLLVATMLSAQTQPVGMDAVPASSEWCELVRNAIGAPYYYCQCEEESIDFAFPMEREISDTVWFKATVNDLKYGLSAYWFANCSITMEVYALCASKDPTIVLTVGPNQMSELDVDEINAQLSEMGDMVEMLSGVLTPRMRAYPNGGKGHVYCYPYDQGPESRCEDPLPLRAGMTYVCDKPENVYRMESSAIPASGNAFVHWKQKKNKPCEVWLTLDSCAGEEIGRAALSDSLHVFVPNAEAILAAKAEQHSLWLHIKHEEGITGRLYWYNNPKFADGTLIADTTCYGKALIANSQRFTTDTAFVDTTWVKKDTLTTMEVALTFTMPEMAYDTVWTDSISVRRGYVYQPTGNILREFGDHEIEYKGNDGCTNILLVTLLVDESTKVDALPEEERRRAAKQFRNGQLIILIDKQKYNVLGQHIE